MISMTYNLTCEMFRFAWRNEHFTEGMKILEFILKAKLHVSKDVPDNRPRLSFEAPHAPTARRPELTELHKSALKIMK